MPAELFEIAGRFRGPPRSGNGGYTCGRRGPQAPGGLSRVRPRRAFVAVARAVWIEVPLSSWG